MCLTTTQQIPAVTAYKLIAILIVVVGPYRLVPEGEAIVMEIVVVVTTPVQMNTKVEHYSSVPEATVRSY